MPLTGQELHCVELALGLLSQEYPGSWTVQSDLDLTHPNTPSPEVLVGNGSLTAAIEVKRVKGDAELQTYHEAMMSNGNYLTPSYGGHYFLMPGSGTWLPFDRGLRRHLKKEIERVAKKLNPGESAVVQVPRHGEISRSTEVPPSFVYCSSHVTGELFTPLSDQVCGQFLLIDDEPEHAFLTDTARLAFQEAVVAACRKRSIVDELVGVDWYEEWELTRVDGYDTNRVEVVAVTHARGVQDAVRECVAALLENALRKFVGVRWGHLHVLVLESEFSFANEDLVSEVLEGFAVEELANLDLVLLVSGDDVRTVWSKTNPRSRTERKALEASEREKSEAEFILNSQVSERRKAKFLEDFLADRKKTATTEMLFRRANAFQQQVIRPRPEDVSWSGFNVLPQKAPFVDLPNWAPYSSWEFAVAMEVHLLARLEGGLRRASEGRLGFPVNRDSVSVRAAFDALAAELQLRGHSPTVFVLAGTLGTQLAVDLQKAIIGTWEQTEQALSRTFRILGIYADIPILHIAESPSPGMYVVDLTKFASLTRYGADPEFTLEEISPQRGKDLLSENPMLVSDPPAGTGLEEERLRQLLMKVDLRLFETYELAVLDGEAVVGSPLVGPVTA